MTLPAPTYDLVLLLDLQVEETARAKIVADARAAIEAQGELLRHDEWGERALTYPIERKPGAEYHLLQFHAGAPELLAALNRSLRISDGILRFRIIKLKPGVPDAPDMGSAASAARQSETEPQLETRPQVEAEPQLETEAQLETEPHREAEPDSAAPTEPDSAAATEIAVGEPA